MAEDYRKLLNDKLLAIINGDQAKVDAAALEDQTRQAQSATAQANMMGGADMAGRALMGARAEKDPYAQVDQSGKQQLQDYLVQRKAARDSESDKFQAVKEMVDLEQAQAKSSEAQKSLLTPKRVDTWIGEKGEPLYEVTGTPGFVTSDLKPYSGKPKSFKQEGVNIQLGGLEEKKKSGERSEKRFEWNKDTKLIDRIGDLGKELNKAGESQYIPYRNDVINHIRSAESAYGPIDSIKPIWMLGPEGQKFRSSVARLIAPLRKDLFGATLTGNEQAAFDTMVGTGKGMHMSSFKAALNKLIEAKDNQINSIKSYDPDATQIYEKQRSGEFLKPNEAQVPTTQKKVRKFNPATGQWES